MEIEVHVEYAVCNCVNVEMPEGKSWDDVKDHWVKYDVLHIEFNDGTKTQQELDTDTGCIDWKRPIDVTIYGDNDLLDNTY